MPRHVSEALRRASARQAARRMIARGERPGYRLMAAQDGAWAIDGLPGVTVTAETRKAALPAATAAIAEILEVEEGKFDLEG